MKRWSVNKITKKSAITDVLLHEGTQVYLVPVEGAKTYHESVKHPKRYPWQ